MIAWTIRCPVCRAANCRRSQSGWVRHLTRLAFIFPLRCRHCQTRFWRLTLTPPPFARPKHRGPAALPGHGSDVATHHADEPAGLPSTRPAHG
jgi:hypothetical protein